MFIVHVQIHKLLKISTKKVPEPTEPKVCQNGMAIGHTIELISYTILLELGTAERILFW